MKEFVHICAFQDCIEITPKTTYEQLKRNVLKVGRFSVFEATSSIKAGKLFTSICSDPDLDIKPAEYPWTYVKKIKH